MLKSDIIRVSYGVAVGDISINVVKRKFDF